MILYLDRLEDIEHMKFRALAQLLLNKEDGQKAFEEYMKIAFPSLARKKEEEKNNLTKLLKAWTGLGPLKVTKMPELSLQSRMKTRAVQVDNEMADRVYKQVRSK